MIAKLLTSCCLNVPIMEIHIIINILEDVVALRGAMVIVINLIHKRRTTVHGTLILVQNKNRDKGYMKNRLLELMIS